MVSDKITIQISKELYKEAEKFISDRGGFSSVEELVEFLLSEVLSDEQAEYEMSKEEEEKVKRRLRSLGYI
ncbi:MAG: CopG family transcriptional regulator [Nitrososphaerota archaeon]